MDRITPLRRSANMAAICNRDTTPELAVRKILRSLRIGYRLHVGGLPGRPDIVMKGRRSIILVHGCFWHRHERCRFAYKPKSRCDFWTDKFARTVARDRRNLRVLRESGWRVLVIWECETADATLTKCRITSFLGCTPNAKTSGAQPSAVGRSAQAAKARARRTSART